MPNLITNQKKFLSEVINNVLPSSQRLYFLVGYFYFSGFGEIYKNVVDKEMKILVGLDIEKDFFNKVKEVEIIQDIGGQISGKRIRDNFNKSLTDFINDTDYFDTPEKQEAFRLFIGKIKDGTLEIKKTKNPNHAKLYLFENKKEFNQGGEFVGTMITGSSNLTRAGLVGQEEINVIFRDANYNEGKEIFDKLLNDSVEIVNKDNIETFLNEVVENIWIDKFPKPFLLYVRVLAEYFSFNKEKGAIKFPEDITKGKYFNLKYQTDAVQQALAMIKKHDGVIVSDVVGLGKSIIASAIAYNLGLKTIIIAPPHLKSQWEDYIHDFWVNAKIYGSGSVWKAIEEDDGEKPKLIIVDEAHRYRNPNTNDYGNLHKLCQGNKVVLLTATPFNNRPQDIFSMIKLFQVPMKSTIQTVDNLAYRFRELIKEDKAIKKSQKEGKETDTVLKERIRKLADQIRDIISPLLIRRSRLDLNAIKEYKDDLEVQNISFPKVNDPEILEYDLEDVSKLYEETLKEIAPLEEDKGFIGARYKPSNYIKDIEKYKDKITEEFGDEVLFKQSQKNLAKFMKHLLVGRFESSVFAFQQTLDSLIVSSELIEDWYERLGKVPIWKKGVLPDVDSLMESTGEDLEEELKEINFDQALEKYAEKGLRTIEKNELKKSFLEDLKKDIALLKKIREEWFSDGKIKNDPKLKYFSKIIKEKLAKEPKRKIIVFTEYADTANYLYESLKNELRVFKYTSKDSSSDNKKTIRENFDANCKIQKDDFDILIGTDAISEGVNLHRAGAVFNYDIPYNPTRVIQRVGRINRINKKVFDELFIYNFFPTSTGERETRKRQISTLKLAIVQALLGEDTKILTSDEEIQSFYRDQFRESMGAQEEKNWDVKYVNFLNALKKSQPKIIDEAFKMAKRVRIKRTVRKEREGVIIFGKKGEDYAFKLGISPKECVTISPTEALNLFEAEITEKSEKPSKDFEPIYQYVKNNLFTKKTEVPYDRGVQEAIAKIEVLKEKLPKKKDYLDDLYYVLKFLDTLPERFAKQIRAISEKNLDEDIKALEKEVNHQYLMDIIDKAKAIEEGGEVLILSEELI
jgi:superfamily II DNA or RNA helicase